VIILLFHGFSPYISILVLKYINVYEVREELYENIFINEMMSGLHVAVDLKAGSKCCSQIT
jgi:hypothetical protein